MLQPVAEGCIEAPALSDRQYRLWAEMLENRTGVRIALAREAYVREQISLRMAERGYTSADRYLDEVSRTLNGVNEWGQLLDRLLVKETRFFRHSPSHEFIRERLAAFALDRDREHCHIWSVGCASGEESYSLAIDAMENLPCGVRFSVQGTDISHDAIHQARRGLYPATCLTEIAAGTVARYFTRNDGLAAVHDEVKQKTAFMLANVLEIDQRLYGGMDIIFCQNVLVYFKQWRRRDVVNSLVECLSPGGCLILGPGEVSDWLPSGARRVTAAEVLAFEKQ